MPRILHIAVLVVAGEMVFGLPFHTARFFRPTVLEVFGFTNTQLGYVQGVYGVTAMLSYFPGGALADRFSARALICTSLAATAAGGFYMATLPGPVAVAAVYGFWGITTIFLFWGALIRATREWGGDASQGAAFGILEAGRGVMAAVFAALAVAVLAWFLPTDAPTAAARRAGLSAVYLVYSGAAIAAGLLAWIAIPVPKAADLVHRNPFPNLLVVLRRPVVWAQAAVIVCAYCGYKATDFFSQYAVVALGMNEVEAARLASYGAWLRPVAALAAGLVADRFDAARSIAVIFGILALACLLLSMADASGPAAAVVIGNLGVSLFAVFALRGVYFALLQQTQTPKHVTGAAVGMISFVGYTPEVYFAWVAGVILDASPGVEGFSNLFGFLAVVALAGIAAVAWLLRLARRPAAI